MTVSLHKIIKIQAAQLMEWRNHPEVMQHLLEQALQRNFEDTQLAGRTQVDPYKDVWRGQDIDHEAVRFLKREAQDG